MAYLDDNNDNLYTKGDPLESLDRELAELKAELEQLENVTNGETQPAISESV